MKQWYVLVIPDHHVFSMSLVVAYIVTQMRSWLAGLLHSSREPEARYELGFGRLGAGRGFQSRGCFVIAAAALDAFFAAPVTGNALHSQWCTVRTSFAFEGLAVFPA